MIAIHKGNSGFHPRWVKYCEEKNIPFKRVDCYANDVVEQVQGCDALLWHHSQGNPKDILIAKQILSALDHTGTKVFPDYKTGWHFDDKLSQKYLFESIDAPLVPSYIFFSKEEALDWIEKTSFPKVFKLRGGAGSENVRLIKSKQEAKAVTKKAFGKGLSNYDAFRNLKERIRKWRLGKESAVSVLKGIVRLAYYPDFARVLGREIGYVYFQDFIPNNDHDIRIIVIDGKAFGLKRYVRENDFRASGSGKFGYKREEFDERCIKLAFKFTNKLNLQVGAFDFVFDNNVPKVVEVSYGYVPHVYDPCEGYWDEDLNWYPGYFNHEGWIVDQMLKWLFETYR